MKKWSYSAKRHVALIIIILGFGGGLLGVNYFSKNNPWPESTVSVICDRNLTQEMEISGEMLRWYSDDRFWKICYKYHQKKYLKEKAEREINREIITRRELEKLEAAWKKMKRE